MQVNLKVLNYASGSVFPRQHTRLKKGRGQALLVLERSLSKGGISICRKLRKPDPDNEANEHDEDGTDELTPY